MTKYKKDKLIKEASLKALKKIKVLKPAKQGKITRAAAKKAVQKVLKLRASKHQLSEMMDKIRDVVNESINELILSPMLRLLGF